MASLIAVTPRMKAKGSQEIEAFVAPKRGMTGRKDGVEN